MKITNISKSSFGQEWDNGENGGSHFSITSGHYNGSLDNIRIYNNRILNSSEIEALYDELQTGIQSIGDDIIQLYPNPATDGFYLSTGEKTISVSIYDLNGTLLLTKQVIGKEFIPVSTLPKGVYAVKITTGNGSTVRKLIKK